MYHVLPIVEILERNMWFAGVIIWASLSAMVRWWIEALNNPELFRVLRILRCRSILATLSIVLAQSTCSAIKIILSFAVGDSTDFFQENTVRSFDFSVLHLLDSATLLSYISELRVCLASWRWVIREEYETVLYASSSVKVFSFPPQGYEYAFFGRWADLRWDWLWRT